MCLKLEVILFSVVIIRAAVTAVTSTNFPESTTAYFTSSDILYLLQKMLTWVYFAALPAHPIQAISGREFKIL